jgi:four helix bundle protein
MKDLKERTRDFALRIIRLYSALPNDTVAQVMGKQLLRSGTSVGAHYREATRARSTAEFVSKLGGGQQELEETSYWLELLVDANVVASERLAALIQEASELIAILTTCILNARKSSQ